MLVEECGEIPSITLLPDSTEFDVHCIQSRMSQKNKRFITWNGGLEIQFGDVTSNTTFVPTFDAHYTSKYLKNKINIQNFYTMSIHNLYLHIVLRWMDIV